MNLLLLVWRRAVLRAKLRNKRSRTSLALKEAWTLVKDLHQLGSLQAGTAGKARARQMESLMRVSIAFVRRCV